MFLQQFVGANIDSLRIRQPTLESSQRKLFNENLLECLINRQKHYFESNEKIISLIIGLTRGFISNFDFVHHCVACREHTC